MIDNQDEIELRTGRTGPAYTEVHDWVALSGVSPTAGFLYNLLRMHVNRRRGDNEVWLSQLTLAVLCSLSRGDKLKPYLDELVGIEAIDITRGGLHRKNAFTVHSLPPAGYAGPLDIKEWHERNKAKVQEKRAAEKATRDARRAKKAVTPKTGEHPVTPKTGEPVTPEAGQPVTPSTGREPKEREPKEREPTKTPPASGPAAVEEIPQRTVQPTLTGEVECRRTPSPDDDAFGLARQHLDWLEADGAPAPTGDLIKLKSGLVKYLKTGYTPAEIGEALKRIGEPVPSSPQMYRTLKAIRSGRTGTGGGYGRPAAVTDVNVAWADKRPVAASTAGGGRW